MINERPYLTHSKWIRVNFIYFCSGFAQTAVNEPLLWDFAQTLGQTEPEWPNTMEAANQFIAVFQF
ncbi:hypothetical protein M5D96_010114 [Drosophila gunungcola]|uniref:Uncharacterized protein n=1 Tax=Drosophila gunungcola TaxID=103775 RepID=A0A9P9YII4_9MUSC|nr:hypothetical protein M5D96_010114 [Drosophila gunungcola]